MLETMTSIEETSIGVRERVFTPMLGGERSLAVLAEPLRATARAAFVVCRSPGPEQGNLRRLEAVVARALAAAGFAALRVRGPLDPGVDGETALDLERADREAADAVALVRAEYGLDEVGAMGGRLGGTVAIRAAARLGLSLVAAWEPIVVGARYLRDLSLLQGASALVAGGPAADGGLVRGLRLSHETRTALERLDLREDVAAFRGHALVVQAGARAQDAALPELVDRLAAHATPTFVVVGAQLRVPFGESYVRADAVIGKVDTQRALDTSVAETTVAWANEVVTA
jgi:pimeloyl-ACP methyl ester carboxylesterase